MTVALVLAAQADAGLCGQLAALDVRRVDAADRGGLGLLAPGLFAVAEAAQEAGERVLICSGDDALPGEVLTRLLQAAGTAVFTGPPALDGPAALVVDPSDLSDLAGAAEDLAGMSAALPHLGALLGELSARGVSVRVLDPGPDADGAVGQLIGEPAGRDLAMWAAGRQLSPASLYGISFGLGLLAAAWFSEPATRTEVLGTVVLLASFIIGRAGAQLVALGVGARISLAVRWFGAACGMLTEFAVYAALAVSAGLSTSAGPRRAGRDLRLLADRHRPGPLGRLRDGRAVAAGRRGHAAARRPPAGRELLPGPGPGLRDDPGRAPARGILGQALTLPAGERIVVIAVTAIFFGPRLTFLVLLAWGAIGAGFLLAGQLADAGRMRRARGELPAYRGDGVVAWRLGGLVRGQLPPLPPLLVALFVTCVLALLGLANLSGVLVFTPAAIMLLAALGARHPHDGRADWLAPSLLLIGEGVFLAGLGFSRHVWLPLIFALLAAVATRHADLAYRARCGLARPVRHLRPGLGRPDAAGRAGRGGRPGARRLPRPGRLAVAAGRLGLPRRVANPCERG